MIPGFMLHQPRAPAWLLQLATVSGIVLWRLARLFHIPFPIATTLSAATAGSTLNHLSASAFVAGPF